MVSWTLIQFLSARSQVKPEITRDFVAFAVNQDQFQQSYILKGKKDFDDFYNENQNVEQKGIFSKSSTSNVRPTFFRS